MGSYKWVIIKITMVITPIRGLITPLITTHEPPSGALKLKPSSRYAKFTGLQPPPPQEEESRAKYVPTLFLKVLSCSYIYDETPRKPNYAQLFVSLNCLVSHLFMTGAHWKAA